MRKIKENLLLVITSMMCVFFMLGCISFSSKAADPQGTLIRGPEFNETLKSFTMEVKNELNKETSVKRIVFTSKNPNLSSYKKVGEGVTAYHDKDKATIYIYSPTKIIFNAQAFGMFDHFEAVESIEFNTNIDTSKVENFGGMFEGCKSLKKIDLKKFNTSSATNLCGMFESCTSLQTVDLSGFNTANVSGVSDLFDNCQSLKSVNLSGFNTSKCTSFKWMFLNCKSLESLDLSMFVTSHVKDFSLMFEGCESLRHLDISSFNTSSATDLSRMFQWCYKLESIDLHGFNTTNVTTMEQMFSGCEAIKSLDVSKFNTSNVSNFRMMFSYCDSLESLDLSSFVIKKDSNCKEMINCYSIDEIRSPKTTEVVIPLKNNIFEDSEFAIDDNKDGVPDSSDVVLELPVASKSSRYIPVSAICEIQYDSNGGIGTMYVNHANRGADYTLLPCRYSAPEGKEFDRWDKGAPGTNIKITKNTFVKAIWKDKTADQPKPSDPEKPSDPTKPKTNQEESNVPTVNEPEASVPANTNRTENVDTNQKSTKISKLTSRKKSVIVTWKKQTKNIKGYEIQYSTDKTFKDGVQSVTVSKSKTTSKIIKKLKAGKKYYFRIRTYKKSGSEKVYSKWSKTKNIKIK